MTDNEILILPQDNGKNFTVILKYLDTGNKIFTKQFRSYG